MIQYLQQPASNRPTEQNKFQQDSTNKYIAHPENEQNIEIVNKINSFSDKQIMNPSNTHKNIVNQQKQKQQSPTTLLDNLENHISLGHISNQKIDEIIHVSPQRQTDRKSSIQQSEQITALSIMRDDSMQFTGKKQQINISHIKRKHSQSLNDESLLHLTKTLKAKDLTPSHIQDSLAYSNTSLSNLFITPIKHKKQQKQQIQRKQSQNIQQQTKQKIILNQNVDHTQIQNQHQQQQIQQNQMKQQQNYQNQFKKQKEEVKKQQIVEKQQQIEKTSLKQQQKQQQEQVKDKFIQKQNIILQQQLKQKQKQKRSKLKQQEQKQEQEQKQQQQFHSAMLTQVKPSKKRFKSIQQTKSLSTPSRFNLRKGENPFSLEKSEILKLKEAELRRKQLQKQLEILNNQITVIKLSSPKPHHNLIQRINISDDIKAKARALELVQRLNVQKKQRQRLLRKHIFQTNKNTFQSVDEIMKMRQQRELKQKERKRVQAIQRMKKQQIKKNQTKMLQKANLKFLKNVIWNGNSPLKSSNQKIEIQSQQVIVPQQQQTQSPIISPTKNNPHSNLNIYQQGNTPQLRNKKSRLRNLRKLENATGISVIQQYNALLFKK